MRVTIIGAGLAGLSAAITLAKDHIESNLVSFQTSERAQSVMAEGGCNGALNTMGEDDAPENHFQDTYKAGVYIADPEAVRGLTEAAPGILKELIDLGTPFNIKGDVVQQRNFGGQKKKRTAYARSSTGKALMSTLIDEARKYEAAGLIHRYPHHEFAGLELIQTCRGAWIRDNYSGKTELFEGPVIMACGGLNGMFPEVTTGTVGNSGSAAAILFAQGVRFSNLEMIQYHPTTIKIPGKCCLVSEAARGEGGRLFIMRGGERWYFMEEKYPELGNLMPRDVVARESYFVTHDDTCDGQVYLDMHHLSEDTWKSKLPDLREEVEHYLGIDPAVDPIPVSPGIHYFMGGIDVDIHHKTNIDNLYAAGECCSQYHGANRLGGNSTMGAMYGGRVAARSVAECCGLNYPNDMKKNATNRDDDSTCDSFRVNKNDEKNICFGTESPYGEVRLTEPRELMYGTKIRADKSHEREAPVMSGAFMDSLMPGADHENEITEPADYNMILRLRDIMLPALGIVRDEKNMQDALAQVKALRDEKEWNAAEIIRISFAEAILESALLRKESRGAHYRSDYPETREAFRGKTVAEFHGEPRIGFYRL